MDPKNNRSWHTYLGIILLVGLSAACVVSCRALFSAPRQGWNKSYGPVVPHDTFPADRALCHAGGNWTTIKKDFAFDHEGKTGVPLRGGHKNATCLMCHNDRGPVARFAAQGCSGCHLDPHRGYQGPTCANCHNEMSWQPVEVIAKHNRTRFQLVGAHAAAACFRCHPGAQVANYAGADPACIICHQDDLARAKVPDHVAQNWTTDCQRCHTPTAWKPTLFKHPSSFPLSAGHAGRSCNECHTGGVFTGLSTACASCHLDDYQRTREPNHATANFDTNCASCHGTSTWRGAKFNHTSSFPLTAGHAGKSCSACHSGGVFTGLSTDCVSCHLKDFQKTTEPNHTTSGFDTNCKSCHNTTRWQGATFNHPSSFPLTAGHSGRSCSTCHTGGVYTGLSTSCSSCHLDDYQRTTKPNHTTSGFDTNCKSCHNTARWQGATFNHPSSFPLTGGHAGKSCSACHAGGVYTGLNTACVSCHQSDFQNTTNPNHSTSGFGTDCATCHSTTKWEGAVFNHAFPITSGPHKLACTECHQNAGNQQQFSCTHCHEHAKTTMDNKHREVNNYVWVSQACFQCHPRGRH